MISLSDLPRPLVRYIVGLWRRRWLIVAVMWVLALAGWVALLAYPNSYTSTAQIYLNTDTFLRSFIDNAATSADFEKRVRTMSLQLLSRENMETLVADTGIGAEAESESDLARLVQSLQDSIVVENNEAEYFRISYSSRDPVTAMKVVDYVVTMFIEQDIGAGIIQSQDAVLKVEREIQTLEEELAEKDAEIAAFRSEHAVELAGTERTTRQLDLLEDELSRLEDTRYSAIRNRDELRRLLATTPRTTSGSELDTLKVQLAQLQSQYNENYPDIIALKAKIAELESGSAGLPDNPEYQRLQSTLRSAENEITDLQQRAVRVRDEIEELTLISSQVPAVQAELRDMTRSYEQIELLFKDLLAQKSSLAITANLSEGGGTIDYNIFEAPVVAARPSNPPRGLMTILILFVAGGAAGALAFVMAHFDRSYVQSEDLEASLGLPVLGSISPVLTPKYRSFKFAERAALAMSLVVLGAGAVGLFWYQEVWAPANVEITAELSRAVGPGGEG